MVKLVCDEKPWHSNNFSPITRSDIPSLFLALWLFGGVGEGGKGCGFNFVGCALLDSLCLNLS